MRPRSFALGFLAVCLIVVGRVAATPARIAAPAPNPNGNFAHFIPISLHNLASDESLAQTATADAMTATALPTSTATATATTSPDPTATATSTPTSTPTNSQTFGLSGAAFVRPRWMETTPVVEPVLYEIILDTTEAMSYDFAGHGTIGGTIGNQQDTVGGTDYQCELIDPGTPPDPLPATDTCTGGANSPWRHYQERRGYIVKQTLFHLIDQMRAYDAMQVIAYSSDVNGMAQASASWSSDKASLKTAILTLGAYNQDAYRSIGYGSGAIALQKAQELLATAPPMAPNGRAYKRVLIFLSAGVTNIFLDGTLNTARDICGNLTIWQAIHTAAPCQVGATATNVARPITALIDQANSIKSSNPSASIFVVSLASSMASTGLSLVASDPSMFYVASQAGAVGTILDDIQSQVQITGTMCTPRGGDIWVDQVDAAHTPHQPPAPGGGVFGYTYIYDAGSGTPRFTLPIQHDSSTGRLGFAIPPPEPSNPGTGIPPGNYEIEAYIDYKGDDGITRQYDYFINQNSLSEAHRIALTVSPASAIGMSVPLPPIYLDLQSTVSVCP